MTLPRSETTISSLSTSFPVGKAVQVRIIQNDPESSRIVASIRQAASNYKSAIEAIQEVEIGNTVEGAISEIQKEKAVVTLHPTQVRALLSLNNLANRRKVTLAQLRTSLQVGDKLTDLVITSRNPEKGFVLVATKPKEKEALAQKQSISLETVKVGDSVIGRVIRHVRGAALVKVNNRISGLLHPTDVSDDFEAGSPFPPLESIVKAVVVSVDQEKRTLVLSTRPSLVSPEESTSVVDKAVEKVSDLVVGSTVRGFIKSVAEHGLFVTVGRNVDARVQIRELFDEVRLLVFEHSRIIMADHQ